ncbi:hypothetical protein AB0M43_35875 [Longispora sp. NPDC051575]|uniref:hypothetical protein n=1 Tax=Longispora sp. NPDC051575 TaxID=3154943 RepID=UPI00343431AF
MIDEDEPRETAGADHQFNMIDIIDAFAEHDHVALRELTPTARSAQLAARQALYNYFDILWEAPRSETFHPADDADPYGGIAAVRDLASALVAQVELVQDEVGDDE